MNPTQEASAAYEEASQKLNGVPSCNRYPLLEDAKKAAVEEALKHDVCFLHGVPVFIPEDEKQRIMADLFPAPHADQ